MDPKLSMQGYAQKIQDDGFYIRLGDKLYYDVLADQVKYYTKTNFGILRPPPNAIKIKWGNYPNAQDSTEA